MGEPLCWRDVERWARAGWRVVVQRVSCPPRVLHYAAIQTVAGPLWIGWKGRTIHRAGFTTYPERLVPHGAVEVGAIRRAIPAGLIDPVRGLRVGLHGTLFQHRIWSSLLEVPLGRTLAYGELAARAGAPGAARAVGQAVARNPVALFVPCHRVVSSGGGLGGYHWGPSVKMALLAWERRL